jgi:hypothetical protein
MLEQISNDCLEGSDSSTIVKRSKKVSDLVEHVRADLSPSGTYA